MSELKTSLVTSLVTGRKIPRPQDVVEVHFGPGDNGLVIPIDSSAFRPADYQVANYEPSYVSAIPAKIDLTIAAMRVRKVLTDGAKKWSIEVPADDLGNFAAAVAAVEMYVELCAKQGLQIADEITAAARILRERINSAVQYRYVMPFQIFENDRRAWQIALECLELHVG